MEYRVDAKCKESDTHNSLSAWNGLLNSCKLHIKLLLTNIKTLWIYQHFKMNWLIYNRSMSWCTDRSKDKRPQQPS